MASYLGNNPDNIIKVRKANYRYVATAGQTVFSGSDSNNLTMQINTSDVEVFLNGVLLDQTDYTATISSITLTSGATIGDIVEVITNTEFQVSSLYTKEEVDLKVSVKADTTTVNSALATKADTSAVNSALALKSDTTTTVTKDSSTGAATIPTGTTAQRPASPVIGQIRYNTTTSVAEVYTNTSEWIATGNISNQYQVEYLVVGGGGGGGSGYVGGGAGGFVSQSKEFRSGLSYTITVGAGGTGGAFGTGSNGSNGGNSIIANVATAFGGAGNTTVGGSGVGGGVGGFGYGIFGQGRNGGTGVGAPYWSKGGGGGAMFDGSNGTSGNGGKGGDGSYWINGTAYAGGGGGSSEGNVGSAGAGGLGGGGAGGATGSNNNGVAGTANTGGGGGGGSFWTQYNAGGNGGSGVVIIRYAGSQRGTGGTVTSSGGYTYHTFTTSGVYTA